MAGSVYAQWLKLPVMPLLPSIEAMPLRHDAGDSLRHVEVFPRYVSPTLPNQHIENPAIRYAIANLKENTSYRDEMYRYVRTLTNYAENRRVRRAIDYVQNYMETIPMKEEAIRQLKERMARDSAYLYSRFPGADSLGLSVNENIERLLYFMEHDEHYRWLKEKSRDSVLMTLLAAHNRPIHFWVNTSTSQFFHFRAETFMGDSIGTWMQVFPNQYKIRLFLDENVFQLTKYPDPQEYTYEEPIPVPDSVYETLAEFHLPPLRERRWWYYTTVSISFGQGYISDNWSAGGESSLSILSDLQFFLNYKKSSLTWENTIRYRLGALKNGSEDISKNEDKFEVQSKLGYKAFRHWNYATQFDMNTVFFKTYNGPDRTEIIANFLSPGNFTLSLGLDYKPKDNFSLYLSPIAGQWIHVRDTANVDPTRYGVEAGKKTKSDAGAKVELKNNHELWNFLKVNNRLILFSSYYDNPEYITIDWQVTLNFKINYFLQTSVYMNAVYDRHNSKKIQFKETLGLGINFRF